MVLHRLAVSGGHVLHVEEHGNPLGLPAVVLHGGPGSGSSPLQRAFFDPARYRILCPDQRGAGQSTPRGRIEDNTLADLLADLRLLRDHLHVDRWLVVGGSWGATLALLHALDQPEGVSGLLLRNPFLARAQDIDRFFFALAASDANAWTPLLRQAELARCTLAEILAELFASGPIDAQREAAAHWWQGEQRLAGAPPSSPPDGPALDRLVDRYRVQSHYLEHRCWIVDPPLADRCVGLPAIPMLIVQGTEDAICPPEGARTLEHAAGGRIMVRLVEGAGHDPAHPAMYEAMTRALQEYATR